MQRLLRDFPSSLAELPFENLSGLRVAWLLPTMSRGFYLQPVLREFTQIFPRTVVFTGLWPGFVSGSENSFKVKSVGRIKFLWGRRTSTGYGGGIAFPSFAVIFHLLHFRPKIIFASGFNLWTLLALVLKPWTKWKIVGIYSGSSPNIDMAHKRVRHFIRRFVIKYIDAFITNSQTGKRYLTETLKAKKRNIFARPYQIPEVSTLERSERPIMTDFSRMQNPIFLFIGQLIPRKGLHFLLNACTVLSKKGYKNFSLLVVGDGPQRDEIERIVRHCDLENNVWGAGWVNYENLAVYFRSADVFVFPTLEDIWGMVLLEAMLFGKPVLCSKWAGAAEMVIEGENGYLFDPYSPEDTAELMKRFIDNRGLIEKMGRRSKEIIAPYNPKTSAEFLRNVTRVVLEGNE